MAKRRKIAAPSAEDLDRIEAEFRRETSERVGVGAGAVAPIAQVASEAAQAARPLPAEMRQAQARDQADAERLREAEAKGLVMVEMPLGWIDEGVMVRDRTVIDPEEMEELKRSVRSSGLRLPIEVFDKGPEAETRRYGLISGYRRLRAVRELHAESGFDGPGTVRAVVRDPDTLGGAIVAMVEENEIRTQLSHYERGRIAVIATQQGSFGSVEEAVNTLFAAASKAKRSKIRSFALVYEELGDLLQSGEALKEREGLRLAQALRQGGEARLREALASGDATRAAWEILEPAVVAIEAGGEADPSRGGRPKARTGAGRPTGWTSLNTLRLANGVVLELGRDGGGALLRVRGRPVNEELLRVAMEELARVLDRSG